MHLIDEIKRRIPKGNNGKVGKLEKFKKRKLDKVK
jgi:hypothetical protein